MSIKTIGITLATAAVALTPVLSGHVLADDCNSQYGSQYGQNCNNSQLQVNKFVLNPDSQVFANNLTLSDHQFVAGDNVIFKLVVKNTGNTILSAVNVSDTLPSYLTLSSGNLTYTITNLAAGQENDQQITAKIASGDKLPVDQPTMCLVNNVTATSGSLSDHSSSQFCLTNKVLGATPATGPADWYLLLSASGILGIAGFAFLRSAKVYTL